MKGFKTTRQRGIKLKKKTIRQLRKQHTVTKKHLLIDEHDKDVAVDVIESASAINDVEEASESVINDNKNFAANIQAPVLVVDDDVDAGASDSVKPIESDSRSIMKKVTKILLNCGMEKHFTITLKKAHKKPSNTLRVVSRFALYLTKSYNEKYGTAIPATETEVLHWFKAVINEEYTSLLDFADYLDQKRLLSPGTIKNYVGDIVLCCEWAAVYAPAQLRQPTHTLARIKKVAKDIRVIQSQRERTLGSAITMQTMVETYRAPVGGLEELQDYVNEKLLWAESLRKDDIDDIAYKKFMQLLSASLYVCSPQGRWSGVQDMNIKQAAELMEQWYAMSTQFKTNSKYGYQPVTVGHSSHFLLGLYLKHFRPQASKKQNPPSNSLWLRYNGKADVHMGRHLQAFYKKKGLIINSTTIRALVETHMHTQQLQGNITAQERAAVSNINGHSGAVTKDYYIMEDRVSDVHHASRAFESTVNRSSANSPGKDAASGEQLLADVNSPTAKPALLSPQKAFNPLTGPVVGAARRGLVPLEWGSAHPTPAHNVRRATWTNDEIEYVGVWCRDFQLLHGEVQTVVSKCWDHLMRDRPPAAVAIFHPLHVLDSTRLRHGYRQYCRANNDTCHGDVKGDDYDDEI